MVQQVPIQRQEILVKEEPTQGKFETIQRLKTEEEEPLQGKMADPVQRQQIPDEDEPIQGKKIGTVQRQEISKEEEPLQTKRVNNTGMPDNLKAGVESLSGIDMSDVRVHYNSSKPAELGALAYTQGTNIHVAPGQEKHLPHEAWHVVQQAQRRVQPTIMMKDIEVNDNEGLEIEADVRGEKTIHKEIMNKSEINKSHKLSSIIQFQTNVKSYNENAKIPDRLRHYMVLRELNRFIYQLPVRHIIDPYYNQSLPRYQGKTDVYDRALMVEPFGGVSKLKNLVIRDDRNRTLSREYSEEGRIRYLSQNLIPARSVFFQDNWGSQQEPYWVNGTASIMVDTSNPPLQSSLHQAPPRQRPLTCDEREMIGTIVIDLTNIDQVAPRALQNINILKLFIKDRIYTQLCLFLDTNRANFNREPYSNPQWYPSIGDVFDRRSASILNLIVTLIANDIKGTSYGLRDVHQQEIFRI